MRPVGLETLTEVFCEVLEQMAFMFAEPIEPEEETMPIPRDPLLAHLKFEGEFSGKLSLAVPIEMSAELAANMLGEEADETDAIARGTDALTGLGLTISEGIVERQRGTITATNASGGGARFVVTMPAHQVDNKANPQNRTSKLG